MTERILRYFLLTWGAILLITLALGMGIYWSNWQKDTIFELNQEAKILAAGVERDGQAFLSEVPILHTITMRDRNNQIIYQNMGNFDKNGHLLVLKGNVFLSDGSEIIVSDVVSLSRKLFIFFISLLMFFICLTIVAFKVLVPWVRKRIMYRLDSINLDDLDGNLGLAYPELFPFLKRIRQQNQTIQSQLTKLHENQQTFSAITGNMSEGFIVTDNQGNVLSYNEGAMKLLGAEPDFKGRNALSHSKIFRDVTAEALCGHRMEQVVDLLDRCCQFIASPVIENGQVRGVVIVILDITEKEHRYRLRRDFTANVSHELKTPLTSISGFAEIIQRGLTDEMKTKEFAGDIYKESQRLITLVNDIIRLSELEDVQLMREKTKVNLYHIAEKVFDQLKPLAEKQTITMNLTGECVEIIGVSHIIEEMLFNLCDNAVKYNRKDGNVNVIIGKEKGRPFISVADTGIGIPKSAQRRVFERFYRVDKSHSKKIGGTGLGLSIVKHGANIHKAEIIMDSTEAIGTTVKVLFQLQDE